MFGRSAIPTRYESHYDSDGEPRRMTWWMWMGHCFWVHVTSA